MSSQDSEGAASAQPAPARIVDDPAILCDIVAAVVARTGDSGWTVRSDATWCRVTRPSVSMPDQGWKIHVSATLLSAPIVLSRVAEVLVSQHCAFKFSRDLPQLRRLLANSVDRGSGGKFITAYPCDDNEFRLLAERLHAATRGLPGPVILSDRPYQTGSLVHYRFGRFAATKEFTNEGAFVPMLIDPDGRRVPDERNAWFSPPGWARPPLPAPEPGPASADRVALGGRFVVHKAIRHSYRGGVFRAVDQETGAEVVVKQARPHVLATLDGTDARDKLGHEAEMLERLAPLGLSPRLIALFTHQDNVFLAEELVDGVTLTDWTAERAVEAWHGRGVPLNEAIGLATQLVEIVAGVHAQDLVLRDLTPNNVMVSPDGKVRLIDFEHAAPTGAMVWKAFTEMYTAPEVLVAAPYGPAPTQAADLYSLGATILHLALGRGPAMAYDRPDSRPVQGRLVHLIHQAGRNLPSVQHLAPLVLGLTRDEPEQRWNLAQAEAFLTGPATPSTPNAEVGFEAALSTSVLDRLLADGFAHVVQSMTPQATRLWRTGDFGADTDPSNVQHGAAGVLGVLTRAAQVLGTDELRAGVAAAAGWIDRRRLSIPRLLPGLYFGRAGTAWSMFDAARLLGDEEAEARAVELAKQLPAEWPNPDVCHGVAGAGLTYLHLWLATGDPELEQAVMRAADGLLDAGEEHNGRLLWRVPNDFDSIFAGSAYYGFAHGVAGIGCFLLYAGVATGRPDYLDAARRAGDCLVEVAAVEGEAAWWPARADDGYPERLLHWCNGSAGVGTFLIRLWSVTGDLRYRALAQAAGAAILRDRWYSSTSTCHGLPGHGDFLLDLADFTGEMRYRTSAAELAETLHVNHVIRDGRLLVPDESGVDFTVGYNSGMSGTLGFLLRLRHGGARWWMPDEVLSSQLASAATLSCAAVR